MFREVAPVKGQSIVCQDWLHSHNKDNYREKYIILLFLFEEITQNLDTRLQQSTLIVSRGKYWECHHTTSPGSLVLILQPIPFWKDMGSPSVCCIAFQHQTPSTECVKYAASLCHIWILSLPDWYNKRWLLFSLRKKSDEKAASIYAVSPNN